MRSQESRSRVRSRGWEKSMRFGEKLERLRQRKPLIHNITNYVTANDCANILLAMGALPIMADDVDEVEEITAGSDGLTINMGTLSGRRIPAMLAAGKKANALGHPVVLDPVGVGISALRRQTATDLLREVKFTAIRGNASEIRALARLYVSVRCLDQAEIPRSVLEEVLEETHSERGVDAGERKGTAEEMVHKTSALAQWFSKEMGAVIVVSGETDVVADAHRVCLVENGDAMMRSVTGMGCQLSALITAFLAANPEDAFAATAAAVVAMGICGEMGRERLRENEGSGSYRVRVMDAANLLDGETMEGLSKYRMP